MRSTPRARRGFTLIEMLVVLALVLILAAISVAFIPRTNQRSRTLQAADRLQGWLLMAKQWAKRDGVPTGVRIFPGTTYPNTVTANPYYCTDLQYIQQPSDYNYRVSYPTGATMSSVLGTSTSSAPVTTVTIVPPTNAPPSYGTFGGTIDLWGGQGQGTLLANGTYSTQPLWLVQPGDYLEVNGGGPLHQIVTVGPSTTGGTTANQLTLASSATLPTMGNISYRVIRQPRILPGEPSLLLPQGAIIDVSLSAAPGNSAGTAVDILFAPSGSVIGPTTPSGKLVLWVRDATQDGIVDEQTLITVYVRTGFIAAHPVDVSNPTTLTGSFGPASPQPITISLASSAGVSAGTTLLIDATSLTPEVVQIGNIGSGGALQLPMGYTPKYSHTAGASTIVYINPYSFTQDGKSSGM